MVSRHPYTKEIYHKDTFSRAMKFPMSCYPDKFDFIPTTFELTNRIEAAQFEAYKKKNPDATFIAKPQASQAGNGITLFKELHELPVMLRQKELIVQRYLENPLLLDSIKFDLRVFVIVYGLNPVQAFICDEGLARFCTVSSILYFCISTFICSEGSS